MSNKEDRSEVERIVIENEIDTSDMRNKERKFAFIEETQLTGKDEADANIIRRMNQLGRSENRIDKDFCEFNREEFIHFFEEYPWAYGTFSSIKSIIKLYLEWCRDNGLIDGKNIRELEDITYDIPSHQKMYDRYYFRNLSELVATVNQYKSKYINTPIELRFHIAEVAVLLAWSGVRLKDLLDINKGDIDEKNRTIFISNTKKLIYVPKDETLDIIQVLVDYINSTEYVESDRLIRTTGKLKMTSGYVSALMSRYFGDNDLNGADNDKVVNYNKVYWSGLFSRAREDEIENGEFDSMDVERLGRLFQEDYTDNPYSTSKRLLEYHNYLSYMYGKEFYKY